MIQNIIKILTIFVGAAAVVVFLVRSTLMSADKKKPVHSVYLKIMANHFQLIGTIASIEYNWPEEIDILINS